MDDAHIWQEFYDEFGLTQDQVRDGCHAQKLLRRPPSDAAHEAESIVLIHGLSDSPFYMGYIAEYFHQTLGYNVFVPLLQCHGLREPNGMAGVDLAKWKENVAYAITQAASCSPEKVSIGGLSTGGALAFYASMHDARINGDLYLFSAALDLAGGPLGIVGEVKEKLLRVPGLVNFLDRDKKLIDDERSPYRYTHVDFGAARELSTLIEENDKLLEGLARGKQKLHAQRVFAAHSEADATADIRGIEQLQRALPPERFLFHRIPKGADVAHASLVLREPVTDERANPGFDLMMDMLAAFEASTSTSVVSQLAEMLKSGRVRPPLQRSEQYDAHDAYFLAGLCQLAYDVDEERRTRVIRSCPGWAQAQVLPFSKRLGRDIDTQGFIAVNDSVIVVSFCGSESLPDWLGNAQVVKDPGPLDPHARVHEGFQDALFPVTLQIASTLQRLATPPRPIWITGHSLGGALAVLLAAMLLDDEEFPVGGLYTFGAPRVGNKAFQTALDARTRAAKIPSFRVVRSGDVVPFALAKALKFQHTGQLVRLEATGVDGAPEWGDPVTTELRSTVEGWLESVGDGKLEAKENHLLRSGYLPGLAMGLGNH